MEQLGLKNDVVKLQQILGSKLYSSSYSFISEVCQNATDSMRKAGKADQAFDIGIDDDYYFFVRDYGTSFDNKADIVKYLCTLLESSKSQTKGEDENQEIGKYGIGKISSAAYNSEWFYKIYKNGKGIDLKVEEVPNKGIFYSFLTDYYDTTEQDGVYYKIKLKNDPNTFTENMLEKVKYFQNMRFVFSAKLLERIGRQFLTINDDFVVFKSDLFQYSTLNKNEYMHICLDQYSYNIDWQVLGIDPIQLPIGLRFDLDELDINPTREALIIDDNYTNLVMAKINATIDWFVNKYNEQNPIVNHSNFREYREENEKSMHQVIEMGDRSINLTQVFSRFNKINNLNKPTYSDIPRHIIHRFMSDFARINKYMLEAKVAIWHGKLTRDPYVSKVDIIYGNTFALDQTFSTYKRDYFKRESRESGDRLMFVNIRTPEFRMFREPGDAGAGYGRIYYDFIFDIDKENYKNDPEYAMVIDDYIVYFQRLMKALFDDYLIKLSSVNFGAPPPKKKRVSITAASGEIKVKKARNVHRYTTENCTFADDVLCLDTAYKTPKLTIYGTEQHKAALDSLYPIVKHKINLLLLTEKNAKIMDNLNLHNHVNINKIKDNLDYVSAVITSHHIYTSLEKYSEIINKKEIIRKFVSTKLADDLDSLERYRAKFSGDNFMNGWRDDANNFMNELYKMFLDNPVLFKADVTVILDRVLSEIEKVDFVVMFNDRITRDNWQDHERENILREIKAIKDLCRYRSMKMDWQHYKPIVDEQPVRETENA